MKTKGRSRVDKELKIFEENQKERGRAEQSEKIVFTAKDLISIVPKTENQKKFFNSYPDSYKENVSSSEIEDRYKNFLLLGSAGTGKTFIALANALQEVISQKSKEKIVIIRSVVETRPRGFLPGSEEDKEKPFELPYIGICDELINYQWRNYERLKKVGIIEFETTSNLRGTTMNDCVIIVDECQNMNFHELDTVATRVGKNSRIIFCGDYAQTDLLHNKNDTSGLPEFLNIVKHMKSFELIEFTEDDIVRSGFVKEYIKAKNRIERLKNSKDNK